MIKKGIILCGGEGIRMRPLTFAVPKPLLPIGDHTILEVCIAALRNNGIEEIALSLGWRSEFIKAYLTGKDLGVKIHTVVETMKLGTAGPLALLRDWIDDDVFVTNGDILTSLDIRRMYAHYKSVSAAMTVAVKDHKTQSRFGVVRPMGRGIVIEEKPKYHESISTGMYIISPEAAALVPVYEKFDMPELISRCNTDPDRKLLTTAYEFHEQWTAMEQPEELEAVNKNQGWLDWAEATVNASRVSV